MLPTLTGLRCSNTPRSLGLTGYRVVPDTGQVIARRAGIRLTPEVTVFDGESRLRYRGRIDESPSANLLTEIHALAGILIIP